MEEALGRLPEQRGAVATKSAWDGASPAEALCWAGGTESTPLDPQAYEGCFWAFVGVRGISRIWRECLYCKGYRTLVDLCGFWRIWGENREWCAKLSANDLCCLLPIHLRFAVRRTGRYKSKLAKAVVYFVFEHASHAGQRRHQ